MIAAAFFRQLLQRGNMSTGASRLGRTGVRYGSCMMAAVLIASGATAQVKEDPAAFDRVVKCRSLTADRERLACYDAAIGNLAAAVERKEVAVVTREEVRTAKRSLFGIALPNLKLFGGGDSDEPVQEISSTIRSVGGDGSRYTFALVEGGTWQTTEATRFPPERNDTAVIRRAALGSFLAKFNGARAVRVQRLR